MTRSRSEDLRERLSIFLNTLYAQRYACDQLIEGVLAAMRCVDAVIRSEKKSKK